VIRVGILTVSTLGAAGKREDASGAAIAAWADARGYEVAARAIVPDDTAAIARLLAVWADGTAETRPPTPDPRPPSMDLILTTGGTGLTPTDRTPEATRAVLEREAPGIAEYLRAASFATFPRAALARGAAGVRGHTLIVNLPGSVTGVNDYLAALGRIVEHAVDLVQGKGGH
jgi:molybdenum cofactor synthesis domain-containing protein